MSMAAADIATKFVVMLIRDGHVDQTQQTPAAAFDGAVEAAEWMEQWVREHPFSNVYPVMCCGSMIVNNQNRKGKSNDGRSQIHV